MSQIVLPLLFINLIHYYFCLQLVMSFMACLESCIGHMSQLSLTDELCIGHMHSLPSAVFQTVKATFKHCKVPVLLDITETLLLESTSRRLLYIDIKLVCQIF